LALTDVTLSELRAKVKAKAALPVEARPGGGKPV
jgi:hypothetical protein